MSNDDAHHPERGPLTALMAWVAIWVALWLAIFASVSV